MEDTLVEHEVREIMGLGVLGRKHIVVVLRLYQGLGPYTQTKRESNWRVLNEDVHGLT